MKKYKINLLAGISITFGILFVVIAGSFVLAFLEQRGAIGYGAWKQCLWIGIGLSIVAVFIFGFYVFVPVLKLRDALRKLDDINRNAPMNLWASPDAMATRINELLEELRMSLEREHTEVMLHQQSKYAQLQNQINPHFLYNTLETIRGQAIIEDNYKIADMTEALAKYFRYNISKDNDFVPLVQELENIRNYIQIQQYRFQDRFEFRIVPRVDYDEYAHCLIPKMTLQPIVENAIFHGIEPKVEKGHIFIHIEATDQWLSVIVADDGVGIDVSDLELIHAKLRQADAPIHMSEKGRHNGIAMENVNSRLRYLYGEDCGIHITSTKDVGTEVEILIPKKKTDVKEERG